MVGPAGSPTCTVYVDVTLTRSKVKVKVTGLLNFRQLAKPCMLAAMTAAPLRGFLVMLHGIITNFYLRRLFHLGRLSLPKPYIKTAYGSGAEASLGFRKFSSRRCQAPCVPIMGFWLKNSNSVVPVIACDAWTVGIHGAQISNGFITDF